MLTKSCENAPKVPEVSYGVIYLIMRDMWAVQKPTNRPCMNLQKKRRPKLGISDTPTIIIASVLIKSKEFLTKKKITFSKIFS